VKKIAFFDFDGTITTKDTFLEFIKFTKGRVRFFLGLVWNSPYLIAYKLKIIPNQKAKEKVLEYYFSGTTIEQFEQYCSEFSDNILPELIRPKAIHEIESLKQRGFLIVIVSASPENWISPWAQAMGADLIASCLVVNNGRLTGKLNGKNCHGNEKVRRILEKHVITDYSEIYTYGDTSGDLPMLKLGTHSFYRPFRK
jgi:phosphatidylglycerophosphatase C